MEKQEPKSNLLLAAAHRKAAQQASGMKTEILGKDLSNRFANSRAGVAQYPTKRGGRNGQGKP